MFAIVGTMQHTLKALHSIVTFGTGSLLPCRTNASGSTVTLCKITMLNIQKTCPYRHERSSYPILDFVTLGQEGQNEVAWLSRIESETVEAPSGLGHNGSVKPFACDRTVSKEKQLLQANLN
jgi:hypothetical protein